MGFKGMLLPEADPGETKTSVNSSQETHIGGGR